ncbi:DUF6069 family protein [Streptacidiphilus sp. EB129]|uniref:DUF6069 family protein n=1 Tax=Streptacidiphilus sp. EB129 TaxID=3156262 RepID=UPI0035147D33
MSTSLRRVLTVVAAAVATTVVWLIAHQAVSGGLMAKISSGSGAKPTEITLAYVLVTTVLFGLIGWGLLSLLERSAKGRRNWTVIASVFLLISLAGPLGSGQGTSTKLWLALMHVVAAAVLIPGLTRARADR